MDALLERGDAVVIMHRGKGTPFGNRVGEIRCDRNDVSAVQTALNGARFDVVYDNVYDWERGTTAEQVSAAAVAVSQGLRRYVFTSSVAALEDGLRETYQWYRQQQRAEPDFSWEDRLLVAAR